MSSVYRLGDVVDDYCTRCHLLLSHDIAILTPQQEIAQTTCRTCFTTHEFKHARVPKKPPKKETKQSLMDQVLKTMPELPGLPPPPAPKPKRDLWGDLERLNRQKASTEPATSTPADLKD